MAGLLLANAALGCGPWLVRLAETQSHVGPIASAFWRLALALPLLLIARAKVAEAPIRLRPLVVVLLAGLFFAADLAAWHIGILHTRLANASLLGNVTAILFPLYGFLVARRWPGRRQGLALTLAAVGATVLLGRSYEMSARNIGGDLLCILAGVCYTSYLIALRGMGARIGPVTILTIAVAVGVPVLLVTALLLGEPIVPRDWTPLVLLMLGSQILGQGLILYAVGRVSALAVGLMLLVQPIAAATIGWLAYGERLSPFDAVGAAAILLAIILVRERTPRLPAPASGLECAS